MVLSGQEAPAVVARVLQRLVRKDETMTPPRWVADRVAQGFVKGLHTTGAAIRALEAYGAIDDAYKAMALAAATGGLAYTVEYGGYATAAGYALLAGDAADAAIFGIRGVAQYFAGESQYQYALGSSPVLGSEGFLAEAEAARQSGLMTAVGLIAPGFSGAIGFKNLKDLRAVQRGRALLGERSLDDLGKFRDPELTDLAAYYADLYQRVSKGGVNKLDEADKAAYAKFQDYFAQSASNRKTTLPSEGGRTNVTENGDGSKPPTDPYDVEAWNKYYEKNPHAPRSVGAAAADDPAVNPVKDYTLEDIPHHPRLEPEKRDPRYLEWAAEQANKTRSQLAAGKDPKAVIAEIADSYQDLLRERGEATEKHVALRYRNPTRLESTDPTRHTYTQEPQAYVKEFKQITADELDQAKARLGDKAEDTSYLNVYITKDGKELKSTHVITDEGRVYYPLPKASKAIMDDVIQRTTDLLNRREQLPAEEALKQFADIVHGYHQAVPFERGSDGVSQALVRGLYQAVTGKKMASIDYIDIKAQLMSRKSFEKWFIEQMGDKH